MRKVIVWNMMSLDGYFEGQSSWDIAWFEHAWGEELEAFSLEQAEETGTLLFGRTTYEGMAAHWQRESGAIAEFMNSVPKVVFSRTLERADWKNTTLVQADAAEEVARLKQQPGKNIFIYGSAELVASLMEANLIDEYRIGLNAIVLGAGNPLFKQLPNQRRLNLLEARPLKTGCVILRYEPL